MTDEEKKQRHREVARESARRKNGYYEKEHKGKKEVRKRVVDLSNFDVWYEMNYIKGQNIQPQKVITFKEHIRVLCERDSQYEALLNEYNELVDKYNALVGVEK
ncbi:MAG: hypothetical protein MJ168_10985 [Clostridia bacterium]|nr:hypothetical protein [Clostridia bacterium]